MATGPPHRPVCLLSLDGGGIKGISELLILQHIMTAVRDELELEEEPRPCDYFDLVGGTSTGGLIAIMLVRLRMTASEALRQYFKLGRKIFSKKNTKRKGKEGAFKATTLETSIKEVVSYPGNNHDDGECMLPTKASDIRAKGQFCEAARATTAAPTYFKAISIKWPNGSSNRFVDAGLGFNNPAEEVIEEAEAVFGPSTPLKILVSVGCGVKSTIRYNTPSALDKFLPLNAIETVKNIAADCEKISQNLERYFKHHQNVYFRFNIPEIGDTGLSEVDDSILDRITASTNAFFNVGSAGHTMLAPVVELLCEAARDNEVPGHGITLGKILAVAKPNSKRGHWVVPFSRNKNFVGRESYLNELLTEFQPRYLITTCPWIALDGLGGVGKTQIALQFAYRVQEISPECSVFWVQAIDTTSFNNSYREIAQKLEIPGLDDDKKDVKQLVFAALQDLPSPWLLIIDNADDYAVLDNVGNRTSSSTLIEYLPRHGNGAILFTTRDHKAATKLAEAHVIRVREMSRDESTRLLRNSLQSQHHSLLEDTAGVTELLDFLLDLPLAIRQAAAYMNENSTSLSKYLSFYKNTEQDMIDALGQDFQDRGRYRSQKNPIATTWLISFEQIGRQDPLAAKYLSFIGVILPDNIPISLLPPGNSVLEQNRAIGTLTAYSFATLRIGEEALDVHRLVHLATRNWLRKEDKLSKWAEATLYRLLEVIPAGGHKYYRIWIYFLPHGAHVVNDHEFSQNIQSKAKLLDHIGRCYISIGQYSEAEKMHRQALALRERVLGAEHPSTLTSMDNLALVLGGQGKYSEAETMHRQALALRERVLGAEHPSTLTSMNNLALVLGDQGKAPFDAHEHEQSRAGVGGSGEVQRGRDDAPAGAGPEGEGAWGGAPFNTTK
ncbi:hypothetical protein BP5796_11977 [Coleophoma crateriformis]|uniref:PNPLA domain-containing protein n=1 Tax=Coleophoma crateriformis TaxID=565419 RepID=A0A3D8QB37_9HELO|nr:hypothetical protein BP5796_11977 [Coleophoma crateriformis]